MIILAERPFLRNGHLDFVSDQQSQIEGEERCATAALKIWRLVEAYRTAFTLRRAQYLISYATYSAVLVILQQTHQKRHRFSESLPFFWSALLDFQKGCNIGLKKPLKILKTLLQRLEEASESSEGPEKGTTASYTPGKGPLTMCGTRYDVNREAAPEANIADFSTTESLQRLEIDMWNPPWLDAFSGEDALLDDSMYGLFMPEQPDFPIP